MRCISKKKQAYICVIATAVLLALISIIYIAIIDREKTDHQNGTYLNLALGYASGDHLTMADGRIYYRSQTDHHYLCSSAADGSDKRRLASKIPGAIYVVGDDVYFINVSDGQRLYRVQKDGGGLEQVIDQPIRDIVLLDDVFYYIAAYSERYDKDGLVKDPVRGYTEDVSSYYSYVYSYKIGEEGPRLLSGRVCDDLLSDGRAVYAELRDHVGGGPIQYSTVCVSDGGSTALLQGVDTIYETCIYRDVLYRVVYDEDKETHSLRQGSADKGTERELTSGKELRLEDCRFYGDHVYIREGDLIERIDLSTLQEEILIKGLEKVRGYVVLPDGQIFVKSSMLEGCGELWYRYDEGTGQMMLFEEAERSPHMIANFLDPPEADRPYTFVLPDGSVFIPYITPEKVRETYIDREMVYQDGAISISLPVFNDRIPAYGQINRNIQAYMDSSIQKGREVIAGQLIDKRIYQLKVFYVYVDDRYVCLTYMEHLGGKRHDINTLLFSAETGEQLCLDDLFCVPREIYEGYIFFAIGKAQEDHERSTPPYTYIGKHILDEEDMVKYYDINKFTLTEQGLVVFYHKGTIENVNWGTPFFEIDHQYFSDIYRK